MREYKLNDLYPYTKTLSSSQFLCYLRDPAQFYTEYVMGLSRPRSKAMIRGIAFSEAYADPAFDLAAYLKTEDAFDERIVGRFTRALRVLERAPEREAELFGVVGDWKLRATLDGLDRDCYEIIENKTGAVEWTQPRVDTDQQLTFQAFVLRLALGVPPTRIKLNWVPTTKDGRIVVRFNTKRNSQQLNRFGVLVDAVLANIAAGNWTRHII